MAVSWPFDSTVSQDENGNPVYSRAYSSDVIAKILAKYFRNGVFTDDATGFQVVAAEGMTVTVLPGYANINGRQVYEEADRVLAVQAADETLDRIDSVVLRLGLSVSALAIDLYIVPGIPAATPSAPELTRNASVWELGLANLFIAKGSTSVSQERITDTRLDSERCGVVASIVGDTDTSAYYAQIEAALSAFQQEQEAAFAAWFAQAKDTLSSDAAGNLLSLINRYRFKISVITLTSSPIGWSYSGVGNVYHQTVNTPEIPENCVLLVSPTLASREAYNEAEAYAVTVDIGAITFYAASKPEVDLTINLVYAEVDA